MQNRFTLSRHVVESESHFDLFLEHAPEEKLWTWKIREIEPVEEVLSGQSKSFQVSALRIFDHRNIYLDYQGELSLKRGSVQKNTTGTWNLIAKTEESLTIRLISPLLSGKMDLVFPQKSNTSLFMPLPGENPWMIWFSTT